MAASTSTPPRRWLYLIDAARYIAAGVPGQVGAK